jgi:hypothetical protein
MEKIRNEICLSCRNKKFDLQKGLLCYLTNEKPNFETSCPDYLNEEKYIEEKYLISDMQYINEGKRNTLKIFALLFFAELLSVIVQLSFISFNNFSVVSIVGVTYSFLFYIAIFYGQKWAKYVFSIINILAILAGIVFIIIFINRAYLTEAPKLMTKIFFSMLIYSFNIYYVNFNNLFLIFFDYQNNKH